MGTSFDSGPRRPGSPRKTSFSSKEVFPEEAVDCQKAEYCVWETCCAPLTVAGMAGTRSPLMRSQRWKTASWFQQASGILYSPNQRPND